MQMLLELDRSLAPEQRAHALVRMKGIRRNIRSARQ